MYDSDWREVVRITLVANSSTWLVRRIAIHTNLAAVGPPSASFLTVMVPGMRSIHPHKCLLCG